MHYLNENTPNNHDSLVSETPIILPLLTDLAFLTEVEAIALTAGVP
jgi:hypothetical protein